MMKVTLMSPSVHSHVRPLLPWAAYPDGPLRVIAGWDGANTDALELVRWLGSSLPLTVQVVSALSPKHSSSGGKKGKKQLKKQCESAAAEVRGTLKDFVGPDYWAEEPARVVASAHQSSSLAEAVRDFRADMILLGGKAKKSKSRVLASVAETLLGSGSARPLALAPRNPRLSKKGVTRVSYVFLHPGGFADSPGLSESSLLAARLGVPMRLLALSPEPPSGADFDASLDSPKDAARWYEASLSDLDYARDAAFEAVSRVDEASAADLVLEPEVAVGGGWKQAVHSVKWKKGDLACIGFRPTGQLQRVFGGNPTSAFLRHVPAPALIFPCPGA